MTEQAVLKCACVCGDEQSQISDVPFAPHHIYTAGRGSFSDGSSMIYLQNKFVWFCVAAMICTEFVFVYVAENHASI